ncbi:MAG: hypothetical protein KKI06_04570 [Euryarchaeota archaeon]|nr:hypothetical protein [Euryarchaeota archaeon]
MKIFSLIGAPAAALPGLGKNFVTPGVMWQCWHGVVSLKGPLFTLPGSQ